MIDALISGVLIGPTQSRTSSKGRTFATGKIKAAAGNGEPTYVSIIAFRDSAVAALLAMGDGDSIAVSGELSAKLYQPQNGGEPRVGLDLVVQAVLSPYHVARKRRAVTDGEQPRPAAQSGLPFPDDQLSEVGGAHRW